MQAGWTSAYDLSQIYGDTGEPYTPRGVSTVRRGAFENLPAKYGQASGAYSIATPIVIQTT
ncbi:hypothetical protein D3C74_302510 [compost metagenome]